MRRMYSRTNDLAPTADGVVVVRPVEVVHTDNSVGHPAYLRRFPEKPSTPCREHEGQRTEQGYGLVYYFVGGRRTSTTAHRKAWQDAYGPVPKGMLVLHACDNPPCREPEHLWCGTQQDNIDDMVAKGRENWFHGGRTPKHPIEVRRHIANEVGAAHALAAKYGLNQKTVYRWRKQFDTAP